MEDGDGRREDGGNVSMGDVEDVGNVEKVEKVEKSYIGVSGAAKKNLIEDLSHLSSRNIHPCPPDTH